MKNMIFCVISILFILSCSVSQKTEAPGQQWNIEKANKWYAQQPWLVGCNFVPSTAINPLEMWQAETFDLETIDRELSWAQDIGFNTIRVFLHHLLWEEYPEGYIKRIDQFLGVTDAHKIKVMFVLFDGVWHPLPKPGPQPEPVPFRHNSGWVQGPGADVLGDSTKWESLKEYVKGFVSFYSDDNRVLIWDLYNEPENTNGGRFGDLELKNKEEMAYALLKKTFQWAREVNPSQPLTAGLWTGDWSSPDKMDRLSKMMLDQSDIVSFHDYSDVDVFKKKVEWLKVYNRPLVCTEYMARPSGSTYENILPVMKEEKIAAYNWGFVNGKSQTIYPWDSWYKTYTGEPELWFHDIFRQDGTPYLSQEVELIRKLTSN